MKCKFPTLAGAIATRGVAQSKIARSLGISYRSFYNKMTGRSSFRLEEICTIKDQFFPDITLEDLFRQE